MLKILIYFILFILAYCNHGFIIVYDTENSRSFQYRDCVYFMKEPEIPYCERPYLKPTEQKKMNTCAHSGEKWLFSDLIKSNITPNEVLKWSSAIEMADNYANVYYNNDTYTRTSFLCNCTEQGTFGKYCEYKLTDANESFENIIEMQFKMRETYTANLFGLSIFPTYKTLALNCEVGLLDLDWRYICDGYQQCMYGVDEENCDLLEFNECEDNEYRCTNGMCIDEEFWLDSKRSQLERFIEIFVYLSIR